MRPVNQPDHSAMSLRKLKKVFVGTPIASEMQHNERIPKWKALAVLSSDALSSVAYAMEEVLIPLAMVGAAAVSWSLPIAVAIAILLIVITISYRQTIDAYPGGGGAYTVARENIGVNAGLVAGAALLIDYILTVSVSVSAGIENIASAYPQLLPHKVAIDVAMILIIMLFNLRGVRESANVFALPTYLFIFSFITMIAVGAWKYMTGDIPAAPPLIPQTYAVVPIFILLKAFSSGCSALTGIEAISNGIPIFKEPGQRNAKITMAWMSFILGALFLAITVLAHFYGIVPKEGETAVSLLAHAIFGDQAFYYVVQVSTTLILILAANTSYADFPRLSSLLAKDRYLPRQLASLGDRLVFSNGIVGLSVVSIILVVIFRGDTHNLIPLYAIGVFLSFTLSQSGMVIHHLKFKELHWRKALVFNALGALTTALVLVVIGISKFWNGAWLVILLIPCFVFIFRQIHEHYVSTQLKLQGLSTGVGAPTVRALKHTAVVPISGLHQGVVDALRYAMSISSDVRAVYIEINPDSTEALKKEWLALVPDLNLVILKSPFRSVIGPFVDYVDQVERDTSDEVVTVIIPEYVTSKWYHQLLHNQTAILLYAALRSRRDIIVTSVRYFLDS